MNDMRVRVTPGVRLGSYEINAPLGAGGMGEVWRAEDTRLGRQVALKVLPPNFAADPERRARFEREARVLASLNHPNIAVLYGIEHLTIREGPSGPASVCRPPEPGADRTPRTLDVLVMELVEGENLAERLERGPVPVDEAVPIAVQIVEALAEAHKKGIIHRDLKPANVRVRPDGTVKVLDFGLAKRDGPDEDPTDLAGPTRLTSVGTAIGTFDYMSPEQMRGEEVDARTDVFAFGALLYEMVTGRLPFPGRSGAEIVASVLKDPVRPPSTLVSPLPGAIDGIVMRALEKDRRLRTDSAARLVIELRSLSLEMTAGKNAPRGVSVPRGPRRRVWLAAGGMVALLGVLAIFAGPRLLRSVLSELRLPAQSTPLAVPLGRSTRIAVLPFKNLGPSADEYFAAGMTDEVRSKLAGLPGLAVIARGSVDEYKDTTRSPTQIASELGVRYLLSATVRWQKAGAGASRVRVTPELVEVAAAGAPVVLWQEDFDAVLEDVFSVQTNIATRVAGSLRVALDESERRRISAPPTSNLAAYEAFLRGQQISVDLTADDPVPLQKAIVEYEQAVALDPQFGLAWSQLSRARSNLYSNGVPTPDLARAAREAAERARQVGPDLPDAWLALGEYEVLVSHDAAAAHDDYHKGLALSPGHLGLLTGSAVAEVSLGRWEEAVTHLREASVLDPRSVLAARRLGFTLLRLRRYKEALAVYDHGLEVEPANLDLIEQKAMVSLAQGDLETARAVLASAADEVEPAVLVAFVANYWDLYWVLDDDQQRLLLRLTPNAFGGDRAVWGLVLAETSALRGDRNESKHYAEQARQALVAQLATTPKDAQRHSFLGLALAYLGERREAVREADLAVKLLPRSRDAYTAPYLENLHARIDVLVGEPEKAIDRLESLLKTPFYLAPGWLRIDPEFAPLRGNRRFDELSQGHATTR